MDQDKIKNDKIKREMIEKGKDFLRNNFDEHFPNSVVANMSLTQLLWDFEKWMS